MSRSRNRQLADLPQGSESPLNAAVHHRDQSALDMVRQAVKHREVMLAYQPVCQAEPPHGPAFFEGLVRVLDSTGRVIPARDFMAEAEQDELGRELDCIGLDQGLRTLARHENVRLSLNMSARSIGYKKWTRILERHLKERPTLGDRLMIEFNQTSAMQMPELVIDLMDRLQPNGIAFALDDFGAGPTIFRHLRDFFFDAVKIHGAFVRGIAGDPDNQSLVRALVAVAREFDMLVIAMSVETLEDAEFLASIGVDCLQGYLFAAPTMRPPWLEDSGARKRA